MHSSLLLILYQKNISEIFCMLMQFVEWHKTSRMYHLLLKIIITSAFLILCDFLLWKQKENNTVSRRTCNCSFPGPYLKKEFKYMFILSKFLKCIHDDKQIEWGLFLSNLHTLRCIRNICYKCVLLYVNNTQVDI